MSQTEKSSPKLFQALCVVLIVTTIIGFAGTLYYYNGLNSIQSKYDALKTSDETNVQKIDSLNSNIASLNSQISTLQAQQTANLAQIAHLQTELSANYTLLLSLEAPNVIATIAWSHVASAPPFCFIICIGGNAGSATINAIAYANLGTTDTMATVAVSFYSTPTASGAPLCTTPPITLGTVKAQTIYGLSSPMGGSCTWPEPPAGGMGVDALSYSIKVSLS